MNKLPAEGNVTQDFYTPVNYIAGRTTHEALDIVHYDFVHVHALFTGKVLLVIDNVPDYAQTAPGNYSGYGNEVWVVSFNGRVKQRVAHLQQGAPVQDGDTLWAGQPIGRMGQTGYRFPMDTIHTHYEIYVDGVRVDPYSDWEKNLDESLTEDQMSELETRVSKLEAEMEIVMGKQKKTSKNTKRLRSLAVWAFPKRAKKLGIKKPKKK